MSILLAPPISMSILLAPPISMSILLAPPISFLLPILPGGISALFTVPCPFTDVQFGDSKSLRHHTTATGGRRGRGEFSQPYPPVVMPERLLNIPLDK